jgi:hypothetical protein
MIEEKLLQGSSGDGRCKILIGLNTFQFTYWERKNVLSPIIYSGDWAELCRYGHFVHRVAEFLQETGIKKLPEYSPKEEFNWAYIKIKGLGQFELHVASEMAKKMLEATHGTEWDAKIKFEDLFRKTFPQISFTPYNNS